MPGPLSNPDGVNPEKLKARRIKGETVVTGKTAAKRKRRVRNDEDE